MNLRFPRIGFIVLAIVLSAIPVIASDHDDGEIDLKGRALSLTDVYVFREDSQTGSSADAGNLILIMNTNPRSVATQQYYFSNNARYEFHLSRTTQKTARPTGKEDVLIRFEFGAPTDGKQNATITFVSGGQSSTVNSNKAGGAIVTTTLADSKAGNATRNEVTINGQSATVFAGLREDPFFFDVDQYFRVRDAAIRTKSFIGFLPPTTAKDFAHHYNVNAIVMRVPIALLQSGAREQIFDAWTTISVRK